MIHLVKNRVAVIPIRDPDVSPGGIIIPDIAKERVDQGIIKYIGPDVKDYKVTDYVLFSGYTGSHVVLEGEGELMIMPEEFIICRLDDVPTFEVPGLYFKTRVDVKSNVAKLNSLLWEWMELPEENKISFGEFAHRHGVVMGEALLMNATYEDAMNMSASALRKKMERQISAKTEKPKREDYAKLRAGAGT